MYWLEEQGIPVAYVDTPGRVHDVRRDGDVFVMEYATLKYIVPQISLAGPEQQRVLMRKQFERQGIYRALRLAGAKPGDRVRMAGNEFTLDELPEPPKGWLAEGEGIAGYSYIETNPIGRMNESQIRELAQELVPKIEAKLLATAS